MTQVSDHKRCETVEGHKIDLSDGRYVFVSQREDGNLIKFCNAKGEATYLRLSLEASDALRHLLARPIVDPGKEIRQFLVEVALTNPEAKEVYRWQQVEGVSND